ncbi:flagellar biosynthesis anti-sigma factor FlgM [Klebsiella pneumoniae]
MKALVQEMPDIREDRVRLLKEQVEAGTYHVSGEEIADLIIRRILADTTLQ